MSILHQFEKHPFWPQVLSVLDTLNHNGYQALLVGGCVRDAILGRAFKDFDVVTNATPDSVEKIFPKTLNLGKAFGVIAIPFPMGFQIEVATFRSDGEYNQARHPKKITFSDITTDAARRDFTINALYFDPRTKELEDFFKGQRDLNQKIVRSIGLPEDRFKEDPLRLLRALRFASRLDFQIEPTTWQAVQDHSAQIQRVSRERIGNEIRGIFESSHWLKGVELLRDSPLWENIFGSRMEHSMESLKMLGNEPAGGWLERFLWCYYDEIFLRPSKDLKSLKVSLNEYKSAEYMVTKAHEMFDDRVRLGVALQTIENAPWPEFFNYVVGLSTLTNTSLNRFESLRKKFLSLVDSSGHLPHPILNGEDLLELGFSEGAELGKVRREVYLLQLEGELTSLEAAKEYAKNLL